MADPVETVEVERTDVDCDGGGGALGHPRVFLNIKPDAISATRVRAGIGAVKLY